MIIKSVIEERRNYLSDLQEDLGKAEVSPSIEFSLPSGSLPNPKLPPPDGKIQVESPYTQKFFTDLHEIEGKVIYHVTASEKADMNTIRNSYLDFKNEWGGWRKAPEQRGRNLSRLNYKPEDAITSKEKTLYVGSTLKNVSSRFQQHFGFAGQRTYAMHLMYWYPKEYGLQINVYQLSKECSKDMVLFIEQGFWNYYRPLFGKASGL